MVRSVIGGLGKAALVVAPLVAPAQAAMSAITVAGGELDPAFPGADIYRGVPASAEVPPGKACQAAKSYVDLVNSAQFAKIADLFEEDGVVLEPMRGSNIGREQIRAFYEARIGKMKPEIVAVSYLGDDIDCMVELAAKSDVRGQMRFALVSIDHFTLGKTGKVARMVAFARPPRTD